MTTVREDDLGDWEEIGKGGMARVYKLPDFVHPHQPDVTCVYKKYKAKVGNVPLYGMQQLVKVRDSLDPRQRDVFDRSFNWPLAVVTEGDGSRVGGVLLPLIPDEYFVTIRLSGSGTKKRKPQEAQFLFAPKSYCKKVKLAYADVQQRRQLARSLCYAVGLLHRANVVFGDLSARNLLYRLEPRPAMMLVDCDAVRVHGAATPFGSQPHSPDWEPPEALKAKRRKDLVGWSIQNKQTDLYKLGLAILRILTPGPGCSVNLDPKAARAHLPMNLYTLLQRSLSDDPKQRPTAKTWYQELTR